MNLLVSLFCDSNMCNSRLENGVELCVNEHQKIRYYHARSTEEKKSAISRFFTSRSTYVNCSIIAMLYAHSIGNQPYN